MVIFFKIIMSLFALVGIINPKVAWKITEGWKFKNVEPSEIYLMINRIISVVFLFVLWFIIPN